MGSIAVLLALASGASLAHASGGPLYAVHATWGPTSLAPGDTKTNTAEGQFAVQVQNVGDASGAEDLTIVDKLPAGVTATAIHWPDPAISPSSCTGVGSEEVKCTLAAALVPTRAAPAGPKRVGAIVFSPDPSGYLPRIFIDVSIPEGASGEGTNLATVSGGGAPAPVSDEDTVRFDSTPVPFGIVPGSFLGDNFTAPFPSTAVDRMASDRPFEFRVNFDIAAESGVNNQAGGDGTRFITSNGSVKTAEATLPRGMIGNPEAVPKCDPAVFSEEGAMSNSTACPSDTQVGYLNVFFNHGNSNYGTGGSTGLAGWVLANRVPLYNLVPPKGVLADLAFKAGGLVQGHIYPTLDPAHDYSIKTVTPNISSLVQVRGSEVTVWGVPGDPAHDRFRWYPKEQENHDVLGAPWGSAPIRPFLTNPMDCGIDNGGTTIRLDSYNHPGEFSESSEYGDHLNVSGCDDQRFRFQPEVALQPTSRDAGGPTGLDVSLQVPQRDDSVTNATDLYAANGNVKAIATPPIKRAVVTLPEGMTISPSAAQGLGSCSSAQIGIGNNDPVSCPDNSQYGTLVLKSPALPQTKEIAGRIYIAKQGDNPFDGFLALYLVIEDEDLGLRVKVPGKVELDPQTGQITTTFEDLPQLPVSEMRVTLKGGVRAALVNPSTCGTKTITADFYTWQDPDTPHTVKNSYDVTQKPDGSPCVDNLGDRPFKPQMLAGTLNPSAGSYSPFVFQLTRTDDDQEFSQLGVTLPPGLVAKIAGVKGCSGAGITQALSRTGAGQGALEQSDPSCPADSQIGTTQVGAGVGVPLTYVPGRVYLAGPYQGAPLSMVVLTPLVVGPYDLGVITVRSALHVDPQSGQVTVSTDPFPQIYQGIPVRIRDIRVAVNRPDFTLNPTSCDPMSVDAHVTGTGGDVNTTADDTSADLSQRFQVGNCASLGFAPKMSMKLLGGRSVTTRSKNPGLRVTLKPHPGDANIRSTQVTLTDAFQIDQRHLGNICSQKDLEANDCAGKHQVGTASATTPLLDAPLTGPVYAVSGPNTVLPQLAFVLHGQFDALVTGDNKGVGNHLRTTFPSIPDVPVTSFQLRIDGGKGGYLVNTRNVCAATNTSLVQMVGQNNKTETLKVPVKTPCAKAHKKKHRRKHRRHLSGR